MTMAQTKWFHRELVIPKMQASKSDEAISQLGNLLYQNGYVKDSYVPAVLKRELEYATGLPTAEVGVAIPHTDVDHVIKPAIAVGVSDTPIPFHEMGNPSGELIDVRVIFMLAIHDVNKVVDMLRQLIELFQIPGFLAQVVNTKDEDDLVEMLQDQIEKVNIT